MWLNLQIFGARALWSPYFLTFVIILGIAYYLIAVRYRTKFGDFSKPTGKQFAFFYGGLFILYAVKGSPIDLLSHIMLSYHMIQLAFFLLVFPIFMIKGIPEWIWRKFVNISFVKPIVKFFTKPLISLLLFNGLFSIYHLPVVFDFAKSSQVAHTSFSLILLFAAFFVWWPLLTPLKELDTIQPLIKMAYIAGNGVMITPACVLIIFASTPLFAAYSQDGAWIQAMSLCVPTDVLSDISGMISGPEMFSPLSTMEDQQLGGILMKTVQEITYGILLGRVFFTWFTKASLKVDPMPVNRENIQNPAVDGYKS